MIEEKNKKLYLLDSSALMTFLEDEEGADKIEYILRNEKHICPFIVLLELYYITLRNKGIEVADKRYSLLKNLNSDFLWQIDEPTLITAGKFKGQYHLSLADSIIAAFAKINDAILIHKDPEYECLKQEVKQYILPYKKLS